MNDCGQLTGRPVYPGVAEGEALVSFQSIPGWRGFNAETGQVIDPGNPIHGCSITGKVLVLGGGKGSTGWATAFQKARVLGNGPAAMLFPTMDSRSAAAAVVSKVPVVADIDADLFAIICTGDWVKVDGTNGVVTLLRQHEKR